MATRGECFRENECLVRQRRLRRSRGLVTATTIVLTISVACAFQSSSGTVAPRRHLPIQPENGQWSRHVTRRRTQRPVAAGSDALLFELMKQSVQDTSASPDSTRDDASIRREASQGQDAKQVNTKPQAVQFKTITEASRKKQRVTIKKTSKSKRARSSTMPGFKGDTDNQRAYREGIRLVEHRTGRKVVETPQERAKRRKKSGETMYKTSASVPDSLIQFASEVHSVDRISRNEEIELSEKTQEAIRLQNLYEVLEYKLERQPSDEEWCAAAGKINMEAIRQAIDEGVEAKNKLVTSNIRMVQSVVNTYIRNGLSGKYNAGDMMQEGILSLIRAAEKFEPDRGWKFSTYAMYWVRAGVKRSQIQQSRIVVVPQRLHEKRKQLKRVDREIVAEFGRRPTKRELGDAVGMSELQVDRCIAAMDQRCYSLDAEVANTNKPMQSRSGASLIEIVESKKDDGEHRRLSQSHLREDLIETLHRHLSPEEVELLLLRYGLIGEQKLNGQQPTIAEVSERVGLKPDKVRRMLQKSLKQLKAVGVDEWQSFQRDLP